MLQPRLTAVFACNNLMASDALRALQNAGRQVPRTMSALGFDNIPLASAVSPALATVAQPTKELAARSAEPPISHVQHDQRERSAQRIVLETKLIVRDSCAPR